MLSGMVEVVPVAHSVADRFFLLGRERVGGALQLNGITIGVFQYLTGYGSFFGDHFNEYAIRPGIKVFAHWFKDNVMRQA